jgi:hypothetical protein
LLVVKICHWISFEAQENNARQTVEHDPAQVVRNGCSAQASMMEVQRHH